MKLGKIAPESVYNFATDLMDVDVVGLDRLNLNGSLPLPDEACLVCGQRHEYVFTLSGHYLRDGARMRLLAHLCLGRCFTGQSNEGCGQM